MIASMILRFRRYMLDIQIDAWERDLHSLAVQRINDLHAAAIINTELALMKRRRRILAEVLP